MLVFEFHMHLLDWKNVKKTTYVDSGPQWSLFLKRWYSFLLYINKCWMDRAIFIICTLYLETLFSVINSILTCLGSNFIFTSEMRFKFEREFGFISADEDSCET